MAKLEGSRKNNKKGAEGMIKIKKGAGSQDPPPLGRLDNALKTHPNALCGLRCCASARSTCLTNNLNTHQKFIPTKVCRWSVCSPVFQCTLMKCRSGVGNGKTMNPN